MSTTTSRHNRSTRAARLVAIAAAVAVVLVGCGSGSDNTTSASAAGGEDVATGKTSVGTVLVDGDGRTLYAFAADTEGTSSCTDACATDWPPVKAGSGTPSHTEDVTATLGTTTRPDGSTQLTVDGWPMYTYAGDDQAGQATGQGLDFFGGRWWVVDATGKWVKKAASEDNDNMRGGYGY